MSAGTKHGEKITFKGQADEAPGRAAGDLIFLIKQKPHDLFQRVGKTKSDLVTQKEIPLLDALIGFETTVKHLDGRALLLSSRGRVVKPDDIFEVTHEGMPIKDSKEKGNLYVRFRVLFPDRLDADQEWQVRQLAGFGFPNTFGLAKDFSLVETPMKSVTIHPDDLEESIGEGNVQCRQS